MSGDVRDWSEVQIGDIVFGKDEQPWVVTERDGTQYTVEREGRKPYVGNFAGPVRVVETAAQVMDNAVSTVMTLLDGDVLDSEHDGIFLCPVEYDEPGVIMAHLYRLHGFRFSQEEPEETLRALSDRHKKMHDIALHGAPGYVRHHHDPKFWQANT